MDPRPPRKTCPSVRRRVGRKPFVQNRRRARTIRGIADGRDVANQWNAFAHPGCIGSAAEARQAFGRSEKKLAEARQAFGRSEKRRSEVEVPLRHLRPDAPRATDDSELTLLSRF